VGSGGGRVVAYFGLRSISRTVGLFLIVLLTGCREEFSSSWFRSVPTIDGDLEEWARAPFLVVEENRLTVSVANDSNYLYLAGRILDVGAIAQIERVGLLISIDPEGGKNDDFEVYIPSGRLLDLQRARGRFWESMSEEQRARIQQQLENWHGGILVIDRRNVDSRAFPSGSEEGFAAATSRSLGFMAFEIRIPRNLPNFFPNYAFVGAGGTAGVRMKFGRALLEELAQYREEAGRPIGPVGRGTRGGRILRPRAGRGETAAIPEVSLKVILSSGG